MKPFGWFLQHLKKYKVKYSVALAFYAVGIGLALVNPAVMGMIVNEVFEKNNRDALLPLLGLLVLAVVVKSVVRYRCLYTFESVSQSVFRDVRHDFYTRMQAQSYKFFDDNKVGDLMARMTGDLEAVRHFVAAVIYMVFENILYFLLSLILLLTISWELALSMLFIAPFIGYCSLMQAKKIKPQFANVREQFSKLNSVCQENIAGNRVVKAFTREEFEIEKFTAENQGYYDINNKTTKVWVKYVPRQEFLASLMSVFLILIGGLLVAAGRLSLSKLVMANGYLWTMQNPMRLMGWIMNDIQRFFSSIEKVYSVMRFKVDIFDKKDAYTPKGKLKGRVEFKDISFSYTGVSSSLVLKDISFTAEAGSKIGIVGPTGSGKSSLVSLIGRFYDATKGEILIDGVNVKDYKLKELRKYISSAVQDVFLFSDTIEGNIAYGVPEASFDDVVDAAKTADADAFIRKTEEGYDTIVGERGVGLSGGQKQRLSLARAIVTDPSILILDDTTSAVDMETEHSIQTALEEKYSNRTTFIIAHRISSVKSADKIIVLLDGRIEEIGSHDELIAKKGYYYGLYIEQYGEVLRMKGVVA